MTPDQDIWPFGLTLFLLLLAPAFGSFLGVLVDRLPRGEDVVRAPSCCRSCGHRLTPRDLVPILSFVWARGLCRSCGAAIPAWQLYLEIAATGAAVLALAAAGGSAAVLFSCLFLWGLLALAMSDLLWLRLPDLLTASLALGVLGFSAFGGGGQGGAQDLGQAVLGAVLGSGSFWALRRGYRWLRQRQGLGLGDVKLMLGLGAFAGPFDLPLLVLIAAVLGLGAGVVSWRRGRVTARRGTEALPALGQQALPFGTALCGAGFVIWLLRATGVLPG